MRKRIKRPYKVYLIPSAFFIASFLVCLLILPDASIIGRLDFILDAIIVCSTTFSGFILTAIAILMGIVENPLIRYLKNNDGLIELHHRYSLSLFLGIVILVLAIVLGSTIDPSKEIPRFIITAGISLLTMYFTSVITTGAYLLRVFIKASCDPPPMIDNTPSTPNLE